MSVIHKGAGYWSLAALYITFAISNLIAPTLESSLGPRMTMLLSGIPYVLFVLGAGLDYFWLLILLAIGVGFGAALLWTAHGDFLTRNAEDEMGFYSGIFFGIFQTSTIWGNIIAAALFKAKMENWVVFLTLFCVGIVGILLLFLLRRTPPIRKEEESIGFLLSIRNTFLILFDKKMLLLFFFFIYNGFSISVFTAKIPEIIGSYAKDLTGWAMIAFGIAELVGSFVIGKLTDIVGIRIMVIATFIFHFVAIAMTFLMEHLQPYLFFVTTAMCGLADSGLNNQIYTTLGVLFRERAADAFAAFKLVQSLAVGFGMIASAYFSLLAIQLTLIGLAIAGAIGFFTLDLFVQRVKAQDQFDVIQ